MAEAGEMAPEVTLEMTDGSARALSEFRGRPLVLYFYPKDDTTGCTREAQDFTALADAFADAGAAVVGVSKDTAKRHRSFIDKYGLKVQLAADVEGSVCEAFGTWVEKSMYGRQYMGIERATFLIDANGKIARVWRKVKVAGHAEEVLAAVKDLKTLA